MCHFEFTTGMKCLDVSTNCVGFYHFHLSIFLFKNIYEFLISVRYEKYTTTPFSTAQVESLVHQIMSFAVC